MVRVVVALFSLLLATQLSLGQQGQTVFRVGDAFRGPIKHVKTETVQLRLEDDNVIEGSRVLIQIIDYSRDGLTREVKLYSRGSLTRKTVEKYSPSGTRESLSSYDAEGNLISKIAYQYDPFGSLLSESRLSPDGSFESQTFFQSQRSPQGITSVFRISDHGSVETDVNTRDEIKKTSTWTTTKPDGSRQENTFSLDPASDHVSEQLTYKPDGSLALRRVSKVNRSVTRLEATEYTGEGVIQKRTLETREYDQHRNTKKTVFYRWNAALDKFEPIVATYHLIDYFE